MIFLPKCHAVGNTWCLLAVYPVLRTKTLGYKLAAWKAIVLSRGSFVPKLPYHDAGPGVMWFNGGEELLAVHSPRTTILDA
jgi:hypothetical protein